MKLVINLLMVFSCFFSNAQSDKIVSVEYDFNITIGGKMIPIKSVLKCSNYKSTFKNFSKKNSTDKKIIVNDQTVSVNLNNFDDYYEIDINKKTIVFTDNIDNQIYKIRDIPAFTLDWILSDKKDETRTINNFNCNKATLSYRGRNYIAWYTSKIPLPFGPWKFGGLPGLILEIHDTENIYYWTATKIVYPSKELVDFNIIEKLKTKEISLKEFITKLEDSIKAKQEIMLGRLPRGVKVQSSTFNRSSIELVHDWEAKNSKKN